MDASKITALLQKQNTRYVHRTQTVDSSTLTWRNQLRSSTYLPTQPIPFDPTLPDPPPLSEQVGCTGSFCGGQGRRTTLTTGSTVTYPNVFSSSTGSATRVYTSDGITQQRAGRNEVSVAPVNTSQPYQVVLPCTECSSTQNDYLPPVDPYYALKHPCFPTTDQNAKHRVPPCCPH